MPAVLQSHLDGHLELSKLPARERKVILRATAADPNDRYNSCVELIQALRLAASESGKSQNSTPSLNYPTAVGLSEPASIKARRQHGSCRHRSLRPILLVLALAAWGCAGVLAIGEMRLSARAEQPTVASNQPPTVDTLRVDSDNPSAIIVQIDGRDPEGCVLEYEVRLGDTNEWTRTRFCHFVIPKQPAGSLLVQVRAVDVHGLVSAIVENQCRVLAKEP